MKRDEALEILSKEGVLLVLCSLIDNMPYVVAEAAVGAFTPFCFHCFRTWASKCNHLEVCDGRGDKVWPAVPGQRHPLPRL